MLLILLNLYAFRVIIQEVIEGWKFVQKNVWDMINNMKIKKLIIKNVKSLADIEIDLNGKSAVIYGINGTGKSTFLRCITLLYAPIINGIVNRKELRQRCNLELPDIRYGTSDSHIEAEFYFNCEERVETFFEEISRSTGKRTLSKEALDRILLCIKPDANANVPTSVPIFVSYGINRAVWDIPLRIKGHHEFDVYSTYEKAIENRIDFRTFFEWYRNQEDEENSIKVNDKNFEYEDRMLKSVRKAIYIMLPEMSNLHITRKPRLAMVVEKEGMRLNVAQLSDGEKCLIALLGDLARRLAIANPYMNNPLEGTGVVLIDEVELHMHPSWQRKILKVLRTAFPNIQFFITTHSPQVLGEVDNSYNILAIHCAEKNTATINRMKRLDGFDSNYILEEFMGTSSSNENKKKLVRSINEAILSGKFDVAEEQLKELEEMSGEQDEEYILANGFLQRSKRKHAKN